jgi:Flp pilus assembly pilin Flp
MVHRVKSIRKLLAKIFSEESSPIALEYVLIFGLVLLAIIAFVELMRYY